MSTFRTRLRASVTDERPAPYRMVAFAGRILRQAGAGLRRCWWQLLGLAALSFVLHHLLVDLGARVAVHNGPAGMALLVLGITVRLVLIVAMVLVAASHVRVRGRPLVALDVFRFVLDPAHPVDLDRPVPRLREHAANFVMALGPLVLLYAGWQLVNADLHLFLVQLFDYSMATPDQTNNSNINFDEGWQTYISWAVGVWLAKVVLEGLRRRTGRRVLDVAIAYAEVGWIVLAWLVVTSVLGRVRAWWTSRVMVHWWREGVDGLDSLLPAGWDLPRVIADTLGAVGDLGSVLFLQVAQPMIWVAVVGLVLGWGRSQSAVLHGSRVGESMVHWWSASSGRQRFALDTLTRGLREKYVPVLGVLRLMWRSGPLPILTVAALYTVGSLLGQWIGAGAEAIVDRRGDVEGSALETVGRGVRFLLEPLRICFLVAVFGQVLRLRTDQMERAGRTVRAGSDQRANR